MTSVSAGHRHRPATIQSLNYLTQSGECAENSISFKKKKKTTNTYIAVLIFLLFIMAHDYRSLKMFKNMYRTFTLRSQDVLNDSSIQFYPTQYKNGILKKLFNLLLFTAI